MSEPFANLLFGLSVASTFQNIGFAFIGCLLGTLVGVLPGVGPVATIAMLLPITYGLPPLGALIMLAGVFYGAQYGGSTTAILVRIPGETASVVTVLDGNAMARQGRAGAALAIAAIGSFLAGTVATLLLGLAAPPLTALALRFGPPEYFALMTLGLVGSVALATGSVFKAFAMIFVGLLLGLVGTDVESAVQRYTFGILPLADGIGIAAVAMGLFAIADIIITLERGAPPALRSGRIVGLMPTRADLAAAAPAMLRGTGLGSLLGVLPGGGATLAAFAAYAVEKRLARDPSRFGKGAIEGVAAPEAANNAGAQTSFIPLLTLGIPANAVMALMVGAMLIHGIQPGPEMMTRQPELFWGLIASMWIGNLMLLVINLPLVGIWAALLRVPYRVLYPAILLFCAIGVYSIANSVFDVVVTAVFGAIGYVLIKLRFEPAPLMLAMVLGPQMEENLRRAMRVHRGDPTIFLTRPISLVLLLLTLIVLIAIVLPAVRRGRENAFSA